MLDAKPAAFQEPRSLIGSWRRFGSAGPVYEIVGVTEPKAADRPQMRIRVLETGEELDYPLTDLLEDPAEG
jgi:hypothetical protein